MHVHQAHKVWTDGSTVQRAVMLSRAGQCGLDKAKVGLNEVQAVATTDRCANYEHVDLGEASLYNAATLNLHGLPYDYASLQSCDPPLRCPTCNVALTSPLQQEPMHVRMFTWQSHLGRCGGDGRCL
jgi:hypothetical protein